MFKKIFIILILLLLIAFGGVSYYISTIDWNNYKSKITAQIEQVTGKKVLIGGKIDLKFLPTPHLSASNIKIYNPSNGGSEVLAEVKEMVTDLSLMPLLHKRFEINNMNLVDSKITVEFLTNGKTNWHSDTVGEQSFNLSGVDIAFNSVTLQNSTVHILNPTLKLDIILKNLNADISAQSLNGPFRMDGNFVKDNTPAVFALYVGTLSESFSTSLNLVLTHPSSDSQATFDGSIFANNSEIQGNFNIESQKPSTFLNTITGQTLLPEKYNYPLNASVELTVNPERIDLSSFVIKYGDDLAGSGKVRIPLKIESQHKKTVEVFFEMTDFDIMPFVAALTEYIKKIDKQQKPYAINSEYDMIADVTSTRAHYNKEIIHDFKFSADFIDNVLKIATLSGVLPGNTTVALNGKLFEKDRKFSYDLKIQAISQEILKFLEFIKHKPEVYAPSTYQNARTSFDLSGNLNEINLSNVTVSLDKTELSGSLNLVRDRRYRIRTNIQSENINFDNYMPPLTDKGQNLSLAEKMKLFLNKFKFVNDIDLSAALLLKFGIYNKIPFENLVLITQANAGKVDLQQLSIEQISNMSVKLNGKIENLGINPTFENLQYKLSTRDFNTLQKTLKLDTPKWPLFTLSRNFEAEGSASGTFNNTNITSSVKFDRVAGKYSGRLLTQDDKLLFRGKAEIKAPDFVDFMNQINVEYNPANLGTAVFTFQGDVEGKYGYWRTLNMDAFIGLNNFTGALSYQKPGQTPKIKADITANLFELDRFLLAPRKRGTSRISKQQNAFLDKPTIDNTVIDYAIFKNFDLMGKFSIKNLSYINNDIEDVNFLLDIQDNILNIRNFTATKNSCPIKADFTINLLKEKPVIKGSFELSNYPVENFGGTMYRIDNGILNLTCQLDGTATSELDFLKSGKADISFDISHPVFQGFDINAIDSDLKERSRSDDLDAFLTANLTGGQTSFNLIGGDLHLENMKYTLNNAVMASDNATIDISSEGSVESWNTETIFKLTLENLKEKIVPITYKWQGNLSSPSLIVQADELKNHYDSYWAKIEEEKKQAEEARLLALKNAMNQAQEKVASEIQIIETEILPRINNYRPKSFDSRTDSVYASILAETEDIRQKLKDMAAIAQTEYTQQQTDEINLQTDVYQPVLSELISRADSNYLFDMKLHIDATFTQINGIHINAVEKSYNYQNTLNSYTMRLMQLGSLVILSNLDEVRKQKNIIESSILNIEDMYNTALKIHTYAETEETIAMMSKYKNEIMELLENSKTKLNEANEALEELFDYVQDILYFEQTGKHREKPKKKETPKITEDEQKAEEKSAEEQSKETSQDVVETNNTPASSQNAQEAPASVAPETNEILPTKFTELSDETTPVSSTPQTPIVAEQPQTPIVTEQPQNQTLKPESESLSEPENEPEYQAEEQTVLPAEPEIMQTPAQPLLIPVEDDYSSKPAVSGSVQRKSQSAQKQTQPHNVSGTLLKPASGNIAMEGTVTRK